MCELQKRDECQNYCQRERERASFAESIEAKLVNRLRVATTSQPTAAAAAEKLCKEIVPTCPLPPWLMNSAFRLSLSLSKMAFAHTIYINPKKKKKSFFRE